MAIEFGESRHSWVEVNDLIEEAIDGLGGFNTTYLDIDGDQREPIAKDRGHRLMNGLLWLVGEESSIITHRNDLHKLNVGVPDGFEELRGRDGNGWFARCATGTGTLD